MKSFLTSVGVFLGVFFGLFTVVNLLIVAIFPVSWTDVVTCPEWCVVYFFLGGIVSISAVDVNLSENNNKR